MWSWLRRMGRRSKNNNRAPSAAPGKTGRPPRKRWPLFVETLEDRLAPAAQALSTIPEAMYSDTAAGNIKGPASVSENGRYIVYSNTAANLAAGQVMDSRTAESVFLYDRSTGATKVVSHTASSFDVTAAGTSFNPAISADGNWVAYVSNSNNLISNLIVPSGVEVLCNHYNVYLYNVQTGANTLVSHVAQDQTPGNNNYKTTLSDNSSGYVYPPLGAAATEAQSLNTRTVSVSLSGDGKYVVYTSSGLHLMDGQQPNPASLSQKPANIFLYDRSADQNTLISHAFNTSTVAGNGWADGAVINANGDTIAFTAQSYMGQLANSDGGIFGVAEFQEVFYAKPNAGSWVNATIGVVSHQAGSINREASAASSSLGALRLNPTPVITPDGKWIAYTSMHDDIIRLVAGGGYEVKIANTYLFDTTTGQNLLVSHAAGNSQTAGNNGVSGLFGSSLETGEVLPYLRPSVSDDGRFVAFVSSSTNLTSTASSAGFNAFVWDRLASDLNNNVTRITQDSITTAALPPLPTSALPNGNFLTLSPAYLLAPTISADGRYIAFSGFANTTMVPGLNDPNGATGLDALVYDRTASTYTLLNRDFATGTTASNAIAYAPVVSRNGSTSAFLSTATNLLPTTINGHPGRDLNAAIPNDGLDLFAYSLRAPSGYTPQAAVGTNATETLRDPPLPSRTANGLSEVSPIDAVSDDGRFTVFFSNAVNLVAGQVDANQTTDVFLFDRQTQTTKLLSAVNGSTTTGNGLSTNAVISADGKTVLFYSFSTNLLSSATVTAGTVQLYLYDNDPSSPGFGTLKLLSHAFGNPNQGANGTRPGSVTSGFSTLLYSVGSTGLALPSLSANGQFIVYLSSATNLSSANTVTANVNVFLYSRTTGLTDMISHVDGAFTSGNGNSSAVSISGDGSTVAFFTRAGNLINSSGPAHSADQLYIWSRVTNSATGMNGGEYRLASHTATSATTAASVSASLGLGSLPPSLSQNGRYIAYYFGGNLVTGQAGTASATNVFRYDALTSGGINTLVSHTFGSTATAGDNPTNTVRTVASGPAISADGTWIAYANNSTNLLSAALTGQNGQDNVYLWDGATNTNRLVSHASGSATTPGAHGGMAPSISPDGRFVAYIDHAIPVVTDTECTYSETGVVRVFDRDASPTTLPAAIGNAFDPSTYKLITASLFATAINSDGTIPTWNGTAASNMVGQDLNSNIDVFQPVASSGTQAPVFTSSASTAFTVDAPGTFTVTATGSPAPTFTLTGTLPTGVTFTNGVLSGTPAPGTANNYPLTITATNTVGQVNQNFTLTIAQPPTFTSTANTTFTTGTAGTFTVTATGFPAPTFSLTGALPTGVTFNTTTGVLSGTPATGTGGTYPLTISVSNGVNPAVNQSFTLTVNQPPAITSPANTTFTTGTAGSFTVTATGFPAPTFTLTGALPSGVTFNTTTGVLSGTPAAGTGNSYPLTITASNNVGTQASQPFTLTVNQAPAITSSANTTFTTGTAGTFTVTATGFPAPTLSQTGTLPTGVTFNTSTGVLSGTPAAGTGGTYSLTITASNGVGTQASQSFTLTVNQAPAITSAGSTTFAVGAAGTFTVTATGFPAPTFTLTGALPGGVSFNNTTGVLSGTPAAGTSGSYPLTITASNNVGTDATQIFTLAVNQAPAITSANNTTFVVGTAGTFTFTTTGFPTPALTQTGTLPSGVTFVDTGNGTAKISGTPAANTGGTYNLVITASNGVNPATQDFTLTVNQAPAITSSASTTFTTGTAGTFTVTATGFPAPTLALSGTLPGGVTFNATTGVLSGTPAAGTGGTYNFTITASNNVGTAAAQNFALTVNQAPAFTSPSSTTFVVGSAGTFTVTATGFPAPTLTQTGTLPTGITFNAATGVLSGTPAAGTGGTYSFSLSAANGVGTQASQNFTLVVNQAPAITSSASTTFAVGSAGTFTVNATGFPTPVLSLSGTLPSGVSFVDNGNGTATLSGTPAANTVGTHNFTITASNGVSPAATQNFTLTNTASVPASITALTGTPQSTLVTTAFAPLQVVVRDGFGNPVAGVPVTFSVTANGPSGLFAAPPVVVTNGSGVATAPALSANTVAGTFFVTATVAGVSTPATFTLTNLPGSPAILAKIAGDGQSTLIYTTFAVPFQVRVLDVFGNAVATGTPVVFSAPSTGPSGTFGGFTSAQVVSNGSGLVTAPAFTANAQSGSYSVSVASGVASTSFSLTNVGVSKGIIFVDDSWANVPVGTDPDGSGPATVFGPGGDAYATLAEGAAAVDVGGTLVVAGGVYNEPVNITKPAAVRLAGDVVINSGGGAITIDSQVTGTTFGTEDLTLNAGSGAVFFGGAVGATSLASLTVLSAGNVTFAQPVNLSGALLLTASTGDTTFNGGNVFGNVQVTAKNISFASGTLNAGAATLNASEGVTISSAATLDAVGAVVLTGGLGNPAGGSVVIDGLVDGSSVLAQGGPGPDAFTVRKVSGAGLTVEGAGGSNTLTVDLSAFGSEQEVVVTDTSITSSALPAPIFYKATGGDFAGGVTVLTSAADDTIFVESTLAGAPTLVDTAGGNDKVTVASSPDLAASTLGGIDGPLTIEEGSGSNSLIFSDAARGAADTVYVTSGGISTQSVPAAIFFQASGGTFDGGITYVAGSVDDVFVIQGTPGPMTVYAREGDDTFNIALTADSTIKGLVLDGGAGVDTVGVYDQSGSAVVRDTATAGGQGSFLASYLGGEASDLNYQNMDQTTTNVTPEESFIQTLFHEELGWNAGPDAVAYWEGVMAQGGQAAVVEGIANSPAALTMLVVSWYERYLERSPGGGEEQFFVGQLLAGVPQEQVLAQMLASDEYFLLSGGTNEGFVQRLFTQLLGFPPRPDEVSVYVETVIPRLGRGGAALLVVTSLDHRRQEVIALYDELFHRSVPLDAIDFWAQSSLDVGAIKQQLLLEPEFAAVNS